MSTQWVASDVKCPFYRSSERSRCEIACEAVTDAQIQIMRFDSGRSVEEQLALYCSDICRMKRCEQYRAVINIKYGGE